MKRLTLSVFWILLTVNSLPSLFGQENAWPRTVPLNQGMVTIYTPQVDELKDNTIQFRAALAYRATAGSDPVFGAGWFESPVVIDSTKRVVHPSQLTVTETRFPEGTDDIQAELAMVLALQSPEWNLDFSLDELELALKTAEAETMSVNTTPPRVFYRDHPALLISIDGEPVLREIENSPLKAVINTPYPLIFDGNHYYLNAARDVWYRAGQVTGPYQYETAPPASIAAMVNPDDKALTEEQPAEPITAANAPELVISTEPAELIVTDGPAAFVPLVDDLLVLQNSDDDVFMHVSSQNFYIVLAGRWYRSGSLSGPWVYQPSDKLPMAFANIPPDSNQADSRVYVAGTEEAHDAVLDAHVPQTAAIQRGVVDVDVKYDGEPVYQPVDGTDLVYIRNTGSTVLVAGDLYYLVEEGVWYVSSSPNGPWQVSDHRPEQVDRILPTSPVYNTKYVQVYDSTPSVVYVGYTPGYIGSYVYRDTIFYGTGWYYRPWVSPYYYYPRFSTWGFNASYDSWYGWGFGLSWAWGPFSVGYYPGGYWHRNHHWYQPYYGYWGPGRYRSHYGHHGRDRYAHNDYRRDRHDRYDGRYDDSRYDNSRDRGDNYRPRDGERNDNLYSNDFQHATVASTRDKQIRATNRYAGQTGNTNLDDRRVAAYDGRTKPGNKRAAAVSPSELRSKAQLRDVNFKEKNSNLLTDNSGKVYSKSNRKTDKANHLGGNGSADRTTSLASSRPPQTKTANNRVNRMPDSTSVRQPQQKTTGNKQRAPGNVSTADRQSRPARTGVQNRPATASAAKTNARQSKQTMNRYDTRQQSAPARTGVQRGPATASAANTSARQTKQTMNRNDTRQQTAPARTGVQRGPATASAAKTNARQSKQTMNRNDIRQQTARNAPSHAPRQSASPRSQQPKSARVSSPNARAPAQRAPQQSARVSSPNARAPAQSAPQQSARQSSRQQGGTKSGSSRSSHGKDRGSRRD